ELAVDLYRILDFVFLGQSWIVLRPGTTKEIIFFAKNLPQFAGEIRRKGLQQDHNFPLHVSEERRRKAAGCNFIFCAIESIYELHDGRNAGIEMPAAMEIVSNFLNRLVKLALKLADFGRKLFARKSVCPIARPD